jgi:hypothetical protein
MTDKRMIYVVTEGDYSDYHIVAVYETQADADYHREHIGGDSVEEHELNPYREQIAGGLARYRVTMLRGGDTIEVGTNWGDSEGAGGEILWSPYKPVVRGVFRVWARDEQHAIKIANERRTRAIAENLWPAEDQPKNRWGEVHIHLDAVAE